MTATMTRPPLEWFTDPTLSELTPLTVDAAGRVWGHLAGWGTDHIGMLGQRIRPPKSQADYSYFMTGSETVADGDTVRDISVGRLVMGTGHADTALGSKDTSAWYDNTGTIVATVCAGEDAHGIWVAGSVLPDVDEVTLRRFKTCGLSGDWRRIGGSLELVAALSVPTGGFPIPRARVASGAPLALVAAGAVQPATFGRVVDPVWLRDSAIETVKLGKLTGLGSVPAPTPMTLAAQIDAALDRRERHAAMSAKQSEMLTGLDDTPHRFAELLAEVDDAPARQAALVASLDGTADRHATLLAELDTFVVSRMPEQLQQEWLHGEIAARIGWGTDGSFARCQAIAREKGVPAHQIDGMCANLYHQATGRHPGQRKD